MEDAKESGAVPSGEGMSIEDHRAAIDAIDRQLLALLNERAGHSLAVRPLKAAQGKCLYDAEREGELIERLCELNEGPLYDDHVRDLFGHLLETMRGIPSPEGGCPDGR